MGASRPQSRKWNIPKQKELFFDHLRIGIGHTFTTGPRTERDRIFHIAGVRFSKDDFPVSRDWIVNPGKTITRRMFQKSKVSTAQCEVQPAWEYIGPAEITPFFADLDILFLFDLDNQITWFSEVVLATIKVPPVIVNLRTMAQFFLPERDFSDLEALLTRTLSDENRKRSAPRLPYLVQSFVIVLQDVISRIFITSNRLYARPLVYSLLTDAICSPGAPDDFIHLLSVALQATRIRWSGGLVFPLPGHLEAFSIREWNTLDLAKALDDLLPPRPDGERKRPATKGLAHKMLPSTDEHRVTIKAEDIEQAFDKLKQDLPDFQPRPSQRAFARFCANAINRGGIYAVEAGTGTGKTLGYLLPACEAIRRNPGRQFVIVTATKNLQNQIVGQELRKLTSGKSLYRDIRGAVLKGKSNYLCISALVNFFDEVYLSGAHDAGDKLAYLYLILLLIRAGGELESIPVDLRRRFPFLNELTEDVNAQIACLPGICQQGADCIYSRVLQKAEQSDFIVTNQHKLPFVVESLRDRALACVIDEADQFPSNYRSAIQTELSEAWMRRRFLYRILGVHKRRGFSQVLLWHLEKDLGSLDPEKSLPAIESCIRCVENILTACNEIDALLQTIGRLHRAETYGEYRWIMLRPIDTGVKLQEGLKKLAQHLENISHNWESILHSGRYDSKHKVDDKKKRFLAIESTRIEKYLDLTRNLKRDAETIAADFPSDDYVHVFSYQKSGWALARIPFSIGSELDNNLFKPFATVIFTSATLFVDQNLRLFASELCLKRNFDDSLRLSSPFDYKKNVFGAVTTFIRQYDWSDPPQVKRNWLGDVADTISRLVVATYGRSLVLFTNTTEMQDAYRLIQPVLERNDIESFIQNGSSLVEISAFRAVEHSALFGVERFWTGVDFPGPTLSQLIIVRLPNPSLHDPVIEHRFDCQGQTFWDTYYHPLTKLKLKQGFGRLIRSEKDRGIFVILDTRIVEDKRMSSLRKELPVRLHYFGKSDSPDHKGDLTDLVTQGLKTLGLYREFAERKIDLSKV